MRGSGRWETSFYGFDISQTMTQISLINLMMHCISNPNIYRITTLSTRYEEGEMWCRLKRSHDYDLSISRYREIEYEEVEYEKPEVIKQMILELETKICETLEGLEI